MDPVLEELELRRSDALMRTFIGSLPGAVYRFSLGKRWKLDFVTPAIEALSGLSKSSFLGLETVAHPDDAPGLRRSIEAAIAAGTPYAVEYRILHADGTERWVYDNGQAVLDEQGALDALGKVAAVKREARGMVITLSGSVLFASGKSELLPSAQQRLDQVAQALKASDRTILVEGYSDSRGSVTGNQQLSQRRAQAVLDYLVPRGVQAGRIRAVGEGSNRPIAENTTSEGRANNRRVEIVVEAPPAAGN